MTDVIFTTAEGVSEYQDGIPWTPEQISAYETRMRKAMRESKEKENKRKMNNKIQLKFKMTEGYEDLAPFYATPGSAAFDLRAGLQEGEEIVVPARDKSLVPLRITTEIPEGYAAFVHARSGLGFKGIIPSNCVGVIDSDYRGEWSMMVQNNTDKPFVINRGDRVCQAVIKKVEQVELVVSTDLSETERGAGGYGSTGK